MDKEYLDDIDDDFEDDFLDDEDDCENLDDHLDEDEMLNDQNEEALEDDPWEQQKRLGRKKGSDKYDVW